MRLRRRTALAMGLLAMTALMGEGAGAARADSVDDYLKSEMVRRHLPSLTVAVARDGKIVKTQAYGRADLARKTPAAPDTVYGLGSCTKPVTAVAVLRLVEAGKIRLDDPASRSIPGLPAAWQAITVRQLLSHTSGLPNYRLSINYRRMASYTRQDSAETLVGRKALDFAPGTRYEYSNTNYHLLGRLIGSVSGQPYARFLDTQLFRPAGMTATRLAAPPAAVPGQATGYLLRDGVNVPNTLIFPAAVNSGDSGLLSTAPDLARWCLALDAGRLLRPDTMEQMETPGKLADGTETAYGLGWIVTRWNGHRLVAHSGAEPGYSSSIFRFPDDHLALVLLSNTFDGTALTDSLALGVSKLLLTAPPPAARLPDTEPKVTALLRQVLTDLAAGKADASRFTPGMNAALTPAVIAQTDQNLAASGAFKPDSPALMSRADENGLRVYHYRSLYGETHILWLMSLTPDGKIAGLVPQGE